MYLEGPLSVQNKVPGTTHPRAQARHAEVLYLGGGSGSWVLQEVNSNVYCIVR